LLAGYANDVLFHLEVYFDSKEWHNLAVKTKETHRGPGHLKIQDGQYRHY
jgi:hypothetical protein